MRDDRRTCFGDDLRERFAAGFGEAERARFIDLRLEPDFFDDEVRVFELDLRFDDARMALARRAADLAAFIFL